MNLRHHLLAVLALLLASNSIAYEIAYEIADEKDDLDLKTIMQNLQSDAARIVEGLLISDFTIVAEAADRIANHPRIAAAEVALVAAELGDEMPEFKALDTLVHDYAVSVRAAAMESDEDGISGNYKKMLDGCLDCHESFKQRVSSALSQESLR